MPGTIIRTPTIARRIGASVLVVTPSTREARLLGPTASIVWDRIADHTDHDELVAALAATYPDVPSDDRHRTLDEILRNLEVDGLIRRS